MHTHIMFGICFDMFQDALLRLTSIFDRFTCMFHMLEYDCCLFDGACIFDTFLVLCFVCSVVCVFDIIGRMLSCVYLKSV